MMKNALLLLVILYPVIGITQVKIDQTSQIVISGEIKKQLVITVRDVEMAAQEQIGDVTITNHLGVVKETAKGLKGVKIKDLLANLELTNDNPKFSSTYYFVFTANDGYKTVYSWNELFNSPVGEKVYVVSSKDGKNMQEMPERILVITPSDYKTGRRYIKGLDSIIVKRVE
jgi:hypothetical protein